MWLSCSQLNPGPVTASVQTKSKPASLPVSIDWTGDLSPGSWPTAIKVIKITDLIAQVPHSATISWASLNRTNGPAEPIRVRTTSRILLGCGARNGRDPHTPVDSRIGFNETILRDMRPNGDCEVLLCRPQGGPPTCGGSGARHPCSGLLHELLRRPDDRFRPPLRIRRHSDRARQITEAFPWDGAPVYMIRDRDRIYGGIETRRLRAMCIRDKPTAPVSPWQNGFAERLIGSIRRECLDHIVVFGEAQAHSRSSGFMVKGASKCVLPKRLPCSSIWQNRR
jgi:hypothetical protein